jgi:hypothetical protein
VYLLFADLQDRVHGHLTFEAGEVGGRHLNADTHTADGDDGTFVADCVNVAADEVKHCSGSP